MSCRAARRGLPLVGSSHESLREGEYELIGPAHCLRCGAALRPDEDEAHLGVCHSCDKKRDEA
mgnify:CR=1 FL=1